MAINAAHYAIAYDLEGNLIRCGEWEYRYDSLDRLTQVLCAGALREQYRYRGAGMLVAVLDGLGKVRSQLVPEGSQSLGPIRLIRRAPRFTQWEAFWNYDPARSALGRC